MTTNTIIWVTIVFLMGVTCGIGGFIGVCKLFWSVQDLRRTAKKRTLRFIDRLYRKVESL